MKNEENDKNSKSNKQNKNKDTNYLENDNYYNEDKEFENFNPSKDHFNSVTNMYGINEDQYHTRILGYGKYLKSCTIS